MTIRKRGQHYQVDVYTPQGRIRKAAYSLEQAEALEIILRNNAQYIEKYRGRIKRIQADTRLLDALECAASVRWKDSRLGAELKATAKRTIKKILGSDVTVGGFAERYRHFKDVIHPEHLATLRATLNMAVDAGEIDFNVIAVPKPEPRLWEIEHMTGFGSAFEAHVQRYLREKKADAFSDFLIAMTNTGLSAYNVRRIAIKQIRGGMLHLEKKECKLSLKLPNRTLNAFKRNCGEALYFEGISNAVIEHWMSKIKYFFGLEDHDRLTVDVFRNAMLDYHLTGDVSYKTLVTLLGGNEYLLENAIDYSNQSPEFHEERRRGAW